MQSVSSWSWDTAETELQQYHPELFAVLDAATGRKRRQLRHIGQTGPHPKLDGISFGHYSPLHVNTSSCTSLFIACSLQSMRLVTRILSLSKLMKTARVVMRIITTRQMTPSWIPFLQMTLHPPRPLLLLLHHRRRRRSTLPLHPLSHLILSCRLSSAGVAHCLPICFRPPPLRPYVQLRQHPHDRGTSQRRLSHRTCLFFLDLFEALLVLYTVCLCEHVVG